MIGRPGLHSLTPATVLTSHRTVKIRIIGFIGGPDPLASLFL